MSTNRIMAYFATVCLTTSIAFTVEMKWYMAALFSAGLMAVLDNIMGKKK